MQTYRPYRIKVAVYLAAWIPFVIVATCTQIMLFAPPFIKHDIISEQSVWIPAGILSSIGLSPESDDYTIMLGFSLFAQWSFFLFLRRIKYCCLIVDNDFIEICDVNIFGKKVRNKFFFSNISRYYKTEMFFDAITSVSGITVLGRHKMIWFLYNSKRAKIHVGLFELNVFSLAKQLNTIMVTRSNTPTEANQPS